MEFDVFYDIVVKKLFGKLLILGYVKLRLRYSDSFWWLNW